MNPNPIIERLADLRRFLVRQICDQSVTAHISAVDAASTFIELDDLSKTIWFDAAVQLPDDETTVLISLDDGEVWTGYVDGDQWLYVSGDPMEAKVTHWQHLPCPPLKVAA
jgi:hypothetical protein